jgi:hypothetical protein
LDAESVLHGELVHVDFDLGDVLIVSVIDFLTLKAAEISVKSPNNQSIMNESIGYFVALMIL